MPYEQSELKFYRHEDGRTSVDLYLHGETFWWSTCYLAKGGDYVW